jgi:hypothetical protein
MAERKRVEASVAVWQDGQGSNPKSEARNTKQIQRPKFKTAGAAIFGALEPSDFGLVSDFGFRISCFCAAV